MFQKNLSDVTLWKTCKLTWGWNLFGSAFFHVCQWQQQKPQWKQLKLLISTPCTKDMSKQNNSHLPVLKYVYPQWFCHPELIQNLGWNKFDSSLASFRCFSSFCNICCFMRCAVDLRIFLNRSMCLRNKRHLLHCWQITLEKKKLRDSDWNY